MRKLQIILILIFCCIGCSREKQNNDLQFDSVIWKTADKKIRGRMAPDLEKSKLLIDKSRKEVIELLGQIDVKNEEQWIYLIDIGDIYDFYFKINFDEKTGKVRSSYIGD